MKIKISEISKIEETTDFSKCKPFPIEFIYFTNQLREMKNWFKKYDKVYEDGMEACRKIDDSIIDIAFAIGDLASCEFVDSYLFNENKEKLIKICS